MEKINTDYLKPHLILWGIAYLSLAWCFIQGSTWVFWVFFGCNLLRHATCEILAINLMESISISKKLFKIKDGIEAELIKTTKDNLRLIKINKDMVEMNEDLIQRLKDEND